MCDAYNDYKIYEYCSIEEEYHGEDEIEESAEKQFTNWVIEHEESLNEYGDNIPF